MKVTVMKTLKILFFLLIAITISPISAIALEGSEGGGAGNAQIAEFYAMARNFANYMDLIGGKPGIPVPNGGFKQFVARVKIKSVRGPLELGGMKVDAINYPMESFIELDDATWAQRERAMKYQIVIHELLGLLVIRDPNYELSQNLAQESIGTLGAAVAVSPSTDTRWNPQAPVQYKSLTTNFDGSVTISGPRLKYGNRYYEILYSTQTYRANCTEGDYWIPLRTIAYADSAKGLCAFFGKSEVVNTETALRSQANVFGSKIGGGTTSIELDKNGRFKRLLSTNYVDCMSGSPLIDLNVIRKISCN